MEPAPSERNTSQTTGPMSLSGRYGSTHRSIEEGTRCGKATRSIFLVSVLPEEPNRAPAVGSRPED